MAFINRFRLGAQGRQRPQTEAINGEVIPLSFNDERFLQLKSVGSGERQERGKQSQNIRLSREAFEQLVDIGRKHFEG